MMIRCLAAACTLTVAMVPYVAPVAPQPAAQMQGAVVWQVPPPTADPCPGTNAPVFQCATGQGAGFLLLYVQTYFHPDHWDLMHRVGMCESDGIPWAENPNSTASGLFQMLDGWTAGRWNPSLIPAFHAYDPNLNAHYAAKLFYANGADGSDWYASRHCWG